MKDNLTKKCLISFEKFNFFNIFNTYDVCNFYKSVQAINTYTEEELLNHYKKFGTDNIYDIFNLYLGEEKTLEYFENIKKEEKLEYILKYCHPYSFKILNWNSKNKFEKIKYINRNKIIEDYMLVENSDSCECYDIKRVSQNLWLRVYGIRIVFQVFEKKSTLIFDCIVDDIILKDLKYTLKDKLIYTEKEIESNSEYEEKCVKSYFNDKLDNIIKEFMSSDLFYKRKLLISFLNSDNKKISNVAYLLYDLLNTKRKSYEFNSEKKIIHIILPNYLKNKLTNNRVDINNYLDSPQNNVIDIPMDTKIRLLKVDDSVKQKLFLKLKELKSRSDDNGKVRQYLEGVLSIPFGVYVKEEILEDSKIIKEYSNTSIIQTIYNYEKNYHKCANEYDNFIKKTLLEKLKKKKRYLLIEYDKKFKYLKKNEIINEIINMILKNKNNKDYVNDILYFFKINENTQLNNYFLMENMKNVIYRVNNSIKNIKLTLDKSVYAHNNVKREIQRIFSQWITGEQDGYSIGFEGPPGVGKTTIAKYGISECLKDNNGNKRPFNFLSLGGSNNSNLLDGHNYTYVGSTWGKLVDFLIRSKCMNPIIYIDELDKVSKTEHGKEIIGILTHLIDSSQNQHFSDKYFSGISFDFSKVLFIFSYNDASFIDPILLDRIHRIKFKSLKLKEKIVIVKSFIIPELFKKLDMNENIVVIEDNVIENLIEYYTNESGVRKLKELLYIIFSELNIELVNKVHLQLPVNITIKSIEENYLKDKNKFIQYEISKNENKVYGLWANALGMGGVLPIDIKIFPTNNCFELKLTGLPGTVMKESMHVAQTLSWDYLSEDQRNGWNDKKCGIHIHCPDGSTNKDGPSAGSALTVALISFLTNKKIKMNVGITGEIDLNGNITAIGGLELKIMGGIKAGLNHFIFPNDNLVDFKKITEREGFENVNFYNVGHISDILNILLY